MKRIVALCFFFVSINVFGQTDQRLLSTKIADVLAKFPVQNKFQFQNVMKEISSMGNAGLAEMVKSYNAHGKGNNTNLEYALQGYTSYVSEPGNEKQRAEAVKVFNAALSSMPDDYAVNFFGTAITGDWER